MGGWGMRLSGYNVVESTFKEAMIRFKGDTAYVVGPTVQYAVYVDQGTENMRARPFAEPAAERVKADPEHYAEMLANSAGVDISTQSGFVRALALAVEMEMKRIITTKEAVDTGQMRASVSVEKVR